MRVVLAHPADFAGVRLALKSAIAQGMAPHRIEWCVAGSEPLALVDPLPLDPSLPPLKVPRRFAELAELAVCHRDPNRFLVIHEALIRLLAGRARIDDRTDAFIDELATLAQAVSRDRHKMRAFLRFREVTDADGPHFIAWFEPAHHIVRLNGGFFLRRFASQRWTILTPDESLHWDGAALHHLPGASRADAPAEDPLEAIWTTYYASIFNPARLKLKAMQSEMPRKYWKNLPEAALIPALVAGAEARTEAMLAAGGDSSDAAQPAGASLDELRDAARGCTRCPLSGPATQTVFGEGPADAPLMIVGEQPGDQEDRQGRPFVGPAGQLLDRCLAEAGIDRARAYVTNAVKHFKFMARGPRRIHASPSPAEIEACRWWLDREIELVNPRLILMLGASAARSFLGRPATVGRERGRPIPLPGGRTGFLTVHPSYLLRIEDPNTAEAERARFVADLGAAANLAQAG
ncbi:MAG: UdgX family uracil-DNA binding protein [Sphingomonadaceae bacterium]